ncbi:MAG: N-acetylmuramoyl-L-alanine amidase [Chitinophagaceae bacterium]|nr:N-acetylmuramoyl-L-alanine amidase [Chitinophagaceae bacterium]
MKFFPLIFTSILFLFSCKDPGIAKRKAAQPEINPRSSWNAVAPKAFATHVPVRITVHHEGTKLLATDDAIRKIKGIQTWGMGPDRKWADVPYHFFIAPDGKIYEGRDINTVGETNTEYNPAGHLLICCLGNYEEYEVPEAQLQSLIHLIAWCSTTYKIPAETLATHRDFSKQTTCPGKNLYKYFESGVIKEGVRKILGIESGKVNR